MATKKKNQAVIVGTFIAKIESDPELSNIEVESEFLDNIGRYIQLGKVQLIVNTTTLIDGSGTLLRDSKRKRNKEEL